MGEIIVLKPAGGISSPDIAVDMAEVSHISSAGLRLTMSLSGKASSVQLLSLNSGPYGVSSITGPARVMDV